jgi:hypothetical protein
MRTSWVSVGLALLIALACGRLDFEPVHGLDSASKLDATGDSSAAMGDADGDAASMRKLCGMATDCPMIRCGCGLCDPSYGECCMQATDCASLRCGCGKCDPMPGDCCTMPVDCASLVCVGGKCQ